MEAAGAPPTIMRRYMCALFDLDGTLIDSNNLIVTSFQHTFREKLGREVEEAEILAQFGEPLERIMGRYAPERVEELTSFYRAFNMANHDSMLRQFDGVKHMVAGLHAAGVQLAVVTSKGVDAANRGLRCSGLHEHFQHVVGLEHTEKHKPNPEPVLKALERLEVLPGDHVVMIGDSFADIESGRAAGCRTVAVGWSLQNLDSLRASRPDHWVDHPSELLTLLLGV
eukprot:TRINITY_DN6591_c0_g1_i1.p2 TRINITY_DN6591_c0_g1~~TRINITY_DN6591_c0_g1_i1.p2  ORF type:complete len:226 (+),score=89.85 TRINITY_DN6591_c0_g1_i1:41-718(+)